jgi:uncharacterized OB-fold protein
MKLCEKCGYFASDVAIYCIMCGKKLKTPHRSDDGVINNFKNLLHGQTADEELIV